VARYTLRLLYSQWQSHWSRSARSGEKVDRFSILELVLPLSPVDLPAALLQHGATHLSCLDRSFPLFASERASAFSAQYAELRKYYGTYGPLLTVVQHAGVKFLDAGKGRCCPWHDIWVFANCNEYCTVPMSVYCFLQRRCTIKILKCPSPYHIVK
jgi:hypothetical protein